MKRILLTGFEPFGGEVVNPSWQVARALHGVRIGGARDGAGSVAEVVAIELPCVFGAALRSLEQALQAFQPALVLSLGQAEGRCELSVERIAINVDDARIPDNAGASPVDLAVVAGGPAAYFTTLPIKAIVTALRAQELPASVSQTAGTFVCNHVFYGLMHLLRDMPAVRAGFMHVPLSTSQAAAHPGKPSMSLVAMEQGVRLALATAWCHHGADLALAAGALD